jgi:hypothetical protein
MIYALMLMFLMPTGKFSLIEVRMPATITVQTATTLTCAMSQGQPTGCTLK